MTQSRCFWAGGSTLMQQYHDDEWGKPSYHDEYLFEMLILEGMQAGLSWSIVLKKREAMREAFFNFSVDKLSKITEKDITKMMGNPNIIRNRLKLEGLRKNALSFIRVQKEFESFSNYIWHFTNGEIVMNHFSEEEPLLTSSPLSDEISKDLKKRGFTFVGTTIIYSYLEAIGVINDHEDCCDWK